MLLLQSHQKRKKKVNTILKTPKLKEAVVVHRTTKPINLWK
jgi:hypothetical protein